MTVLAQQTVQSSNLSVTQTDFQVVKTKKLELKLENRLGFKANEKSLFYVQDKKIIVLDRLTWKEKWVFQASESLVPKLEVDNKQVYALTKNGYIFALNIETGQKNWFVRAFKMVNQGLMSWKANSGESFSQKVSVSFFLFRNHLMISQPNEYMSLQKNGVLIQRYGSSGNLTPECFRYFIKSYENETFYAITEIFFDYCPSFLPSEPRISSRTISFTNLHKSKSDIFNNILEPAIIFNINSNKFLSFYNATNNMIGDSDYVVGFFSYYYLYNFYTVDVSENPRKTPLGFFRIWSEYRNLEWCKNWCDYTQVPIDYHLLGLIDDRIYFMTDIKDKRYAFFDTKKLQKSITPNAQPSDDIEFSDSRPTSLLKHLGFSSIPTQMTDTDIFALKNGNRYALISNTGQIRVFDDNKLLTMNFEARGKNFIPARDVTLGLTDVVVFDENFVLVFGEEK